MATLAVRVPRTEDLPAMWDGFLDTWPIWLFMAAATAFAVWACWANDTYKRAQRDHRRSQHLERLRTLDHIATTDPDPETRVRAGIARGELRRRHITEGGVH